jgi:hypothetical protein
MTAQNHAPNVALRFLSRISWVNESAVLSRPITLGQRGRQSFNLAPTILTEWLPLKGRWKKFIASTAYALIQENMYLKKPRLRLQHLALSVMDKHPMYVVGLEMIPLDRNSLNKA